MDKEDNVSGGLQDQKMHLRLIDWIFLPLPLAIAVIGFGILAGLFFKENLMLKGSMKVVIGLVLVVYGLGRSAMIINRLRGKRRNIWAEKS